MFYYAQKRTNYWSKIRKQAPKVPETATACPKQISLVGLIAWAKIALSQNGYGNNILKHILKEVKYLFLEVLVAW